VAKRAVEYAILRDALFSAFPSCAIFLAYLVQTLIMFALAV